MLKKALVLFFAFLFSINSFAAVVSDNDGSAFITKGEFDSLKNDFISQINQYNTTMDSKIDFAIASYLAGTKVEKTSMKGIIIKNWDSYTMRNGNIANDYAYPDFDGQESYLKLTNADWLIKEFWMRWNIRYARSTKKQKKVLVDNVTIGATLNTEKMRWAGVATNCKEKWLLSRQDYGEVGDPGYLYDDHNNVLYACHVLNIDANGYMTQNDLNNLSNNVWNVEHNWRAQIKSSGAERYPNGVRWPGNLIAMSVIPSISYEKDDDDVTFKYEHLGTWLKNTSWECNVKGATNYFKTSARNTLGTKGWFDAIPSSGFDGLWTGIEQNNNNNYYTKSGSTLIIVDPKLFRTIGFKWAQQVLFRDEDATTLAGQTNNHTIPTIGLIGDYDSDKIYQYLDNELFDSDGVAIDKITMQQGIPIIPVKKDETIEYEIIFKDVNSTITNKYVVVMLSYVPFSNDSTLTTSNINDFVLVNFDNYDTTKYGKYRKGTSGSNTYYFPVTEKYNTTTKNCKVPIKFKSNRDGIVYLKFFVYDGTNDSSINTTWEATLDIENSSTYKSTKG